MRKVIWIRSGLWTCSECGWAFDPSGPPIGKTMDEMKENFERQRDKAFDAHVCAQSPKDKSRER